MPSRVEFLYVPLQARMVCYRCGMSVPEETDKDNCPLCFEVFCLKCIATAQKRTLPASYGYTAPQSVCVTCDLLLSSFVLLTSQIDAGGAGVLLPPRHAALVTNCMLPQAPLTNDTGSSDNLSSTPPTTEAEKPGFFASLFGKLKKSPSPNSSNARASVRPDSDGNWRSSPVMTDRTSVPASNNNKQAKSASMLRGSMVVNPQPALSTSAVASYSSLIDPQALQMRVADATPLNLVAWRPLNPETSISLGHGVVIYLREIHMVHVPSNSGPTSPRTEKSSSSGGGGSLSPRNGGGSATRRASVNPGVGSSSSNLGAGQNNGKVSSGHLSVHSDGIVQILLKSGHYCEFLVGTIVVERDDDGVDRAVEFLTDAAAAYSVAEKLNTLARHAKQHYAFGKASLALHADLCPAVIPNNKDKKIRSALSGQR